MTTSFRSALYPEHKIYAGAWLDKGTNLVYLDASVIVERRACAELLAHEYGQLAFYDPSADECVYTQDQTLGKVA